MSFDAPAGVCVMFEPRPAQAARSRAPVEPDAYEFDFVDLMGLSRKCPAAEPPITFAPAGEPPVVRCRKNPTRSRDRFVDPSRSA